MSIEYDTKIAYGFDTKKFLDEEENKALFYRWEKEGLVCVVGGNNWSGKLKTFLAIKSSVIKNDNTDGEIFRIDLIHPKKEEIENIRDSCKELGLQVEDIGWHIINSVF